VERDVEFHTMAKLEVLRDVPSQEMCCAYCNGNPECGAWSWGERRDVDDLSHLCFLKKLGDGEEPLRMKRFGVVSGFPFHKLRKHGMVAELLGKGLHPQQTSYEIPRNTTCPGQINVTGHRSLSVVAARWLAPGHKASGVAAAPGGWLLEPALDSRAYLAEACTEGTYQRGDYASLKLLGKTLRYTADLSGAGCGCDARLSLVPMRVSEERPGCEDYYCSARSEACGASCAEIAVQDANQYAWSSSLHAAGDAQGAAAGYGGGASEIGRRDWSDRQYGPGAECIDTTWPFHVEVSFPLNGDGDLDAMQVTLTQDGRPCPLHARVERYGEKGRAGLAELGRVLAEGVTPVVQYAGSKDLAWLDGLGKDGEGPCVRESPEVCGASVRFYGFALEDGAAPTQPAEAPRQPDKSPLEVAFAAVHSSVQRDAARKRMAVLENQTASQEVGLADCGDDCSPVGVGISLPAGEGSNGSVYAETAEDQAEWEVLRLLHVRSTPNTTGKILAERVPGEIVVGHRVGDWIDVAHQAGYAPIFKDGEPAMKQRKVSYEKVVIGTCGDMGYRAIGSASVCKAAAFALGYLDTTVTPYRGHLKRPEGCYVLDGQVFISTNAADRGNGADDEGRMPICASVGYPTTITVTTTTHTTTVTTVTTSTTTTSTTWGFPSLFCFEVMMTTTYEFGLVKEQIRRGAGIFNCDEYSVFSQDPRTYLGKPPHGPPIHTKWFKKAFVGKSQDGTAGNTLLFMHLWDAVKEDGHWKKHDWTVKADPDAVVLPWRIRKHLAQATGPNNYLVNCNKVPGNPNFPMIFGAFEAFSSQSLQTYFDGGDRKCRNELHWQPWGEDFFMHHCMMHLGVQQYDDFGILSDKRCTGANCMDGWAAAYHDFKSQASWFQCWDQAVR